MDRLAAADAAKRLAEEPGWPGRLHALLELTSFGQPALAAHSDTVVRRLEDDDWQVRRAALDALGKLPPAALARHAGVVLHKLKDADADVKRAAASLLEQNPQWLRANDVGIRRAAVAGLALLPAAGLAAQAEPLLRQLDDEDVGVRRAAGVVLAKLEPAILTECAGRLVRRFDDTDAEVRKSVVHVLGLTELEVLSKHAKALALRLDDSDIAVRYAAVESLSKLRPETHLAILETQSRETLLHHAARLNCLHVIELLSTHHRTTFLHAKNAADDTPLHLAAQEGNLEACQLLLRAGALLRLRNRACKTPADLAEEKGHASVFDVLKRRENLSTVRAGSGNALQQAVADKRPVLGIEWYTMKLPGVAGRFGAIHSLLAIVVGAAGSASHTYVIEKATVMRGTASDFDPEQFTNGVYVSHWAEVAPNIDGAPIHVLQKGELRRDPDGEDFLVSALRDIAVVLGEYNVATCNCHHTAMAVYNACAKDKSKVSSMPNQFLTLGVRMMSYIGLDVAHSESMGSQSGSMPESYESGYGSQSAASRSAQATN